ncbi:hypothetical protein CYMTET_19977 [Cymbomonas tetramitiformis]|uniref:Uncharacterized protein n=1 Tax=Cymbomonas tetramitiformis TaxID=36881 RepID=A0AAE0G5F9_9CHLO|nr:hypothetical protein CYMTET_19977 [Cymbomonas tetramitiformis]
MSGFIGHIAHSKYSRHSNLLKWIISLTFWGQTFVDPLADQQLWSAQGAEVQPVPPTIVADLETRGLAHSTRNPSKLETSFGEGHSMASRKLLSWVGHSMASRNSVGHGRRNLVEALRRHRHAFSHRNPNHNSNVTCGVFSDSISDSISDSASDSVSNSASDSVSNGFSDNISDSVSNSISDSVSNSASDSVSNGFSDNISDSASDNI